MSSLILPIVSVYLALPAHVQRPFMHLILSLLIVTCRYFPADVQRPLGPGEGGANSKPAKVVVSAYPSSLSLLVVANRYWPGEGGANSKPAKVLATLSLRIVTYLCPAFLAGVEVRPPPLL